MIVEINDTFGMANESAGIGGEEHFFFAQSDDERTAEPSADDHVGEARTDDGKAIGALDLCDGLPDGVDKVALEVRRDQVSNDLGIGLALKTETLGLQLALE